jgi:Ca2+-binding EF-hand superfamily protein
LLIKDAAKKHPEVVSGHSSSDDIFFAFFDGFRKLCSSSDGYVTLDMFQDYYRVISASFQDDNYFNILMWSVWELAGNSRLAQHEQHRAIVERASKGVGRHKPGPAHRAQSFPVVDRTFHQQKMVESAAELHPVNWEGGYKHKNGGVGQVGEGSSYSIGIVPNASPSGRSRQNWSNSPHIDHHKRSGTADAAKRTYQSSVGQIIGTGNSQSYWGNTTKYGDTGSGSRNGSYGGGKTKTSPEQLASSLKAIVRAGLISRGVHGYISLLRSFEKEDKGDRGGYDGNLPLNEFYKVLRKSGFNITKEQCNALFITLDLKSGSDQADEIDYSEFVNSLCGNITQTRLAMIHQAFRKFDHNSNGFVPLEDLHSGYDSLKHPDVTSGKRLASQVHREFVDNFTVADSHGKVSIEAFELYFKFVSSCYLEDSDFQFMMWNVWNLHEIRAGGQVAGVGLGKTGLGLAAGYSKTPDSPNSLHLRDGRTAFGRKSDFSNSLKSTIVQDQHPARQMKMHLEQSESAGRSSYRKKSSQKIIRDEYGNEFSGAHVLARLVEAGKMLGTKSWIGLTRAFQQASNNSGNGGGGLNRTEFATTLEAFGLGLSSKELTLIFQSFDANGDGLISYEEFMKELRKLYIYIFSCTPYKNQKNLTLL